MVISLAVVAMFAAACQMFDCGKVKASSAVVKPLRVGVYDSRCITIAYVHSKFSKNEIQKLFDIVHKAEKEGDVKTAQSTREIAEYMQKKRHSQGFGTAPVGELLEPIKDEMSKVAEQAGVDMIVSKWQVDYQAKDAHFVDVTDAMAALYNPDEKTLKIIEEMKKQQPIAEEELLKMKD